MALPRQPERPWPTQLPVALLTDVLKATENHRVYVSFSYTPNANTRPTIGAVFTVTITLDAKDKALYDYFKSRPDAVFTGGAGIYHQFGISMVAPAGKDLAFDANLMMRTLTKFKLSAKSDHGYGWFNPNTTQSS